MRAGGRCAACASTGILQLAALALLVCAVGTVDAGARHGGADPDPVAPISPNGEVILLDQPEIPSITWKMAHDVTVWKTVSLGAYTSVNMLLEALSSDDCGVDRKVAERPGLLHATPASQQLVPHCHLGESAGAIIGRPSFHLSRIKQEVDLVVLPLVELGFAVDEDVALEDIYDRAEMLGFELCPAEVGPLLRLQYLDQPDDESLHVAMQPIKTYGGEPTDLTVANGGVGLMLIGGDGRPNFTLPAVTRFIFVRPRPKPQADDRASFR